MNRNLINRRRFLATGGAAVLLTRGPRSLAEQSSVRVSFTYSPEKPICTIPEDFAGLSYESSQLTHTGFFSPQNRTLIRFFKNLGDQGVLRLGGNMSEFTRWSSNDSENIGMPYGTEGPDPGKGTDRTFVITPSAIRNLAGFLEAVNWKLIYGLNLATGTAESASDEAEFVYRTVGSRLLAFQFGNEPDLFKHNNDPAHRWTYPEFLTKWRTFQASLRERMPKVPLAGPDASFKPDWVGQFAEDSESDIRLLTAHYYAEGPPSDPRMNIEYLLRNTEHFESHIVTAAETARKHGIPYRMSEGNTCYMAGKKGVSDTFASALWAGDFLLQLAATGASGANMHGGGEGLYTPIAGSPEKGFSARPIYYGMMMVKPLAGATLISSDLGGESTGVTGYAAVKQKRLFMILFNKEDRKITVDLSMPGRHHGGLSIQRLNAPSVSATSGTTFGNSAVDSQGHWNGASTEEAHIRAGRTQVILEPYSAILCASSTA